MPPRVRLSHKQQCGSGHVADKKAPDSGAFRLFNYNARLAPEVVNARSHPRGPLPPPFQPSGPEFSKPESRRSLSYRQPRQAPPYSVIEYPRRFPETDIGFLSGEH